MNRPWKVWLWFFLALALVVPAMGWLTHKALQLDQEVADSAINADLEEDISLALWRMDVALAPLVAQEAARPYVVYRPFLVEPAADGTKGSDQPLASPLLVQPSEFVRLHFQLDESGAISSPQCPAVDVRELAIENGAPLDNIDASCSSLSQLSESVRHDALARMLPQETLPPFEVTDLAWSNRLNTGNFNGAESPNELNQQVLLQNDSQLSELYQLPASVGFDDQQVANVSEDDLFDPQMAGPAQQPAPPGQAEPNAAWSQQYGDNPFYYGRAPRSQVQRGQVEFQRRNKALQSYANTEVVRQRKQLPVLSLPPQKVQEGVSAPVWVQGELLLARKVTVDDRHMVQGCWFDWEKLKAFLIAEGLGGDGAAGAALPNFDLRPIADDRTVAPARRLATLPVEIVVPTPKFAASPVSPIRISLMAAWICMVFATCAVAFLLQGVVTLSERRGAFVSAVTHELRTPLTTFRMYAEMLSQGMVRDGDQQKQYTETLRVEADRLSHLVENVLAYARLERGRKGGRREDISLNKLLQRSLARLEDRARQAEMEVKVDIPDDVRNIVLHTDPQAVEQILFNLVDNACKYAQPSKDGIIHVRAQQSGGRLALMVSDSGPGIPANFARKLFQPFSKSVEDAALSAPGVGLGLALCRRLASEIGGALNLEPSDKGAAFRLLLPLAQ